MSQVSSSSSRSTKYDVFLSFRGKDTRKTFTSHLYEALRRNNIETYIDKVELKRGDEISPELLRAIEKSKISVVIFSKRYASSRWCLDELVQILDCKDRNGQIVVPVFYRVEPSHVKSLQGTYGTDFAALEERYKFRMVDRVKDWRETLKRAANFSGFDSKDSSTDAKLVRDVVADILKKLKKISSGSIDNDMVGTKERIQHIKTLLSKSSLDIKIIGIWGMGGIGKTTLAITIFNRLFHKFDASYCLGNVRENLDRYGMDELKCKLYSNLLQEENLSISSSSIRSTFVSDRLHRMKVLIVLDDVNEQYQVNDLVGDHLKRFGQGSVIIITSRNRQAFKKITTEENIYEVMALNDDEAMRLFQMNAFTRNPYSIEDYMELSRRVIRYAGRIPLALKVLGSLLHGRSKEEWEIELYNLKSMPEEGIQRVLQISYDKLNTHEKEIFLDIACFFKGWDKDRVQDILNGCRFSALIGIRNLINKSLVTVNNNNELEMHDLIRDMGREVDRVESVRLGYSRRLWSDEEVWRNLRYCKETMKVEETTKFEETMKVEGIFYNNCGHIDGRCLNSESFSKMSKLRLLKVSSNCLSCRINLGNLQLSNGLPSLPSEPSFFFWEYYPSKSLPSNFFVVNLVELHFPHSKIERLWDGVRDLPRLKMINGSSSKNLIEFPDLSRAPNLQMIDLKYCTSLETLSKLPSNIEKLDLRDTAIHELPSSIKKVKKLKSLVLLGCKNLEKLSIEKLPNNITELILQSTSINVLPTTIEKLSVLEKLDLGDCQLIECLPMGIFKLKSLIYLSLYFSKLKTFPDILEPMEHLTVLNLSGTRIQDLPHCFNNCINLQILILSGCPKLKKLPLLPHKLTRLYLNNCSRLESLPELPFFLHYLYASGCTSLVRRLRTSSLQDWWGQCKVGLEEGKLRTSEELAKSEWRSWRSSRTSGIQDLSDYCKDGLEEGKPTTHEQLEFFNCLKLDGKARSDIICKSEWRSLLMAATILLKYNAYPTYTHSLCLPGSEILQGFDYQTEGSSINVKFALNQDKASILGFIIGIVVEFEVYNSTRPLCFKCKSHFKSNSNESYEIESNLMKWASNDYFQEYVHSDHIFIFYDHLLHPSRGEHPAFPCSKLNEASFSVDPNLNNVIKYPYTKRCNVKKLGIRLLYADRAKELGFSEEDIERLGDEQNPNGNRTEDDKCTLQPRFPQKGKRL